MSNRKRIEISAFIIGLINFRGRGEDEIYWLNLVLSLIPIKKVKGLDIYINLPISQDELALGADISVASLRGNTYYQ